METPQATPPATPAPARARQYTQLLLLLPFIGTLWIPFYNQAGMQTFDGIPFFYWYLLLWIPLSAVVTAVVYLFNR